MNSIFRGSEIVSMVQLPEGVTPFIYINQNDFSGRKYKKQKEEDIAVCECKYDANDPDSACGERCLNVLTSTECTPSYCPCGDYCKNQRFQKCEYAKTKLFKTEGRGWGLLADENIKAGRFIIEYCGEVITSEEAQQRSQTYEAQGLKDAYIISLSSNYFIDATKKGSLARFINHSCQPNCETRKWTVLGEIRVGIFAKQDICVGTELAYDYNFEWYGGSNVRCLCGAVNCSKFLGAKSSGFLEHNHVWEDGDDRYTVEKIPLYDSAEEDETSSKLPKTTSPLKPEFLAFGKNDHSLIVDVSVGSINQLESIALVEPLYSFPVENATANTVKTEVNEETKLYSQDSQKSFPQSNSAGQNYHPGTGSIPKKRAQHMPKQKSKHVGRKQFDAKHVAKLFKSKETQEEVLKYEEVKNGATFKLDSLYDEIRPAIEEHERDSQDSVPTSVAEKWIKASCNKLKADFDLHFSIVKNFVCPPQKASDETKPLEGDNENENEVKH
ncbi:histone-lysine N-methyltransferase ASHH1 [Cornus florida]|uniref:histone-lysine N-methyltransferase ASHH1 n=1 Tax=Cornus florida TaxID=4283 RepID=UPI0028A113B0|nr:histone-lysine N-methyltransferase ASHH1 [Cornus florida]XP_059654035.1 histone-lysine N-methyltransferase ASHH1 [Cornus florida]XP_059654036.1 histone-lysine N-methyltransferase ASHH1 [Cornus florida]XP_059654037.1 histone-lysine N-methyltransferase ASHH1 [Cornus florida]XP_059654038.1 histone-lysine N-methyltransferase ASHH1 [Cornus florida]